MNEGRYGNTLAMDDVFVRPDDGRGRSERRLLLTRWPAWIGYTIVVIAEVAIAGGLLLLQSFFPETTFQIPYVLAIIPIAYYLGLRSAILAFLLGLLGFASVYVFPTYDAFPTAYAAHHWARLVSLTAGMAAAALVSLLLRRSMLHIGRVTADMIEANEALLGEMIEREKVENALEKSETRFRTTFERAGIGMTVVDMRGNVVTANPAFSEFTGYSLEELPGMNVQTYAYPEDLAHGNELLFEMIEGKRDSYQVEKRYIRKDGSVVWGRLTASIARNPVPEPPFIIGMIEDITERKHAEEALRTAQAEKLEFYRRMIVAATNGKLNITDRAEIDAIAGEPFMSWEVRERKGLSAIREAVWQAAESVGMEEDKLCDFIHSVGEAITNAVKHAGGGIASLHRTAEGLMFVISDQGPGIPALALPDVTLRERFSTVGTLGMGYKVIIGLSDRVYLATGLEGTAVAIEMSLHPAEARMPYVDLVG